MSERPELQDPGLTATQLTWLRQMANVWEQLSTQVPASDGPYTVPDFVEWCASQQKGRRYRQRDEEAENRAAGQQRRQTRSLATAS